MNSGLVRSIVVELALILLIFVSLLTTYGLVKRAYEVAPPSPEITSGPSAVQPVHAQPPTRVDSLEQPAVPAEPNPGTEEEIVEAQPVENAPEIDPHGPEIERLSALTDTQKSAAAELDATSRQQITEIARLESETRKWSQRMALVKGRAGKLEKQVGQLEKSIPNLEQQKSTLAKMRDDRMMELAKVNEHAKRGDVYSVTPYKGPSGTWRRPIVVDCSGDSVRILPDGIVHGSAELGPIPNARAISLVYEVRKKAAEAQQAISPDGAPGVPYILFLVRPDGIRHYYDARTLLESTRIAFGYELIGQDWTVEVPEASAGSGKITTTLASGTTRRPRGAPTEKAPENPDDDLYIWPTDAARGIGGTHSVDPLLEAADSNGSGQRNVSGLVARGASGGLEPGDLLEPNLRKVPDPRRPGSGIASNTEDGTEIIPGRGFGTTSGSSETRSSNLRQSTTRTKPPGAGLGRALEPPGSRVEEPPLSAIGTALAGESSQGNPANGLLQSQEGSNPGLAGTTLASATQPGSASAAENLQGGIGQGTSARGESGPAGQPGSGLAQASRTSATGNGSSPPPNSGTRSGTQKEALTGASSSPGGKQSQTPGATGMRLAAADLVDSVGSYGLPPGLEGGEGGQRGENSSQGAASNFSPGGSSSSNMNGMSQGQSQNQNQNQSQNQNQNQNQGQRSAQGTSASSMSGSQSSQSAGSQAGTSSFSSPAGSRGLPIPFSMGASQGQASSSSNGSPNGQGSQNSNGGDGTSNEQETQGGSQSGPPPKISEEWLEIVIACQPHGVIIQPGGYRLSQSSLESGTLLLDRIRSIAQRGAQDREGRIRRPCLRFVVEAGGQSSFWIARKQTSFIGMDWPAKVQLTETISWDHLDSEKATQ